MMRRTAGVVIGLTLSLASPVFSQPAFTIVARTGQAAPQASASYDFLSTPSLNESGQVAFGASLAGPTANAANNAAIFAGSPLSPSLLIRSGAPAPSAGAGFTLATVDFQRARFNADGHALFGSALLEPGIDPTANAATYAYWLASPGNLQKVAPTNQFAGAYDLPLLTAGDVSVFPANDGLHVWSPANPNPPAVGAPAGLPLINPAGALAFLGSSGTGSAVMFGPPGNLQTVVKTGDPAPAAPAGTQFLAMLFPSVNAAGQVAFHASIGPSGGPGDDESVWVGTPQTLGLVARAGAIAPGTGGLHYGAFRLDIDEYRTPALSGKGEVAFTADLVDGGGGVAGAALFAGTPGHVRLVAREGQHATNAPQFVTVGETTTRSTFTVNARGQVAFLDNSGGLYVADADGGLLLVAGVGLPFELAPGDIRTIAEVRFGELQTATGGEDGRAFAFNDAGQLTFALTFTDNTSAVLFTTVPEPAGIGALAFAACAMTGRGRVRRARGGAR